MNLNANKGYDSFSRSIRSRAAIEDFRIPLNHFNRSTLDEFIQSLDYGDDDLQFLRKLSISQWKYLAKYVGSNEWHHTSSHFNKTIHYDLYRIADFIISNRDRCMNLLKSQESKEINKSGTVDLDFGKITVQVWEGSRKHPKLTGHDTRIGVVKGTRLYYTDDIFNKCYYRINANKVTSFISISVNSLPDLCSPEDINSLFQLASDVYNIPLSSVLNTALSDVSLTSNARAFIYRSFNLKEQER